MSLFLQSFITCLTVLAFLKSWSTLQILWPAKMIQPFGLKSLKISSSCRQHAPFTLIPVTPTKYQRKLFYLKKNRVLSSFIIPFFAGHHAQTHSLNYMNGSDPLKKKKVNNRSLIAIILKNKKRSSATVAT